MKKPLAITFLVEEKAVRKSIAMLTGDVLTEENLSKFFEEPIQLDISDFMEEPQAGNMTMALVAIIAEKKGLAE